MTKPTVPAEVRASALDLVQQCERRLRWIEKEGLDQDDLQTAFDFAEGLTHVAAKLQALLAEELKRQRGS